MQREVVARVVGDVEPNQRLVDEVRPGRSRQLDHAQRAERLVRIAAVRGEPEHHVAERERLPHHGDGGLERGEVRGLREAREHRAVHPALVPSAHLVPVVARELELGLCGEPQLRERDEVLEARLARDLLPQEPAHLIRRRRGGEPREQRIVLAGTGRLQGLEPRDERVGIRRCGGGAIRDPGALGFEDDAFEAAEGMLGIELGAPVGGRKASAEAVAIAIGEIAVERFHHRVGMCRIGRRTGSDLLSISLSAHARQEICTTAATAAIRSTSP